MEAFREAERVRVVKELTEQKQKVARARTEAAKAAETLKASLAAAEAATQAAIKVAETFVAIDKAAFEETRLRLSAQIHQVGTRDEFLAAEKRSNETQKSAEYAKAHRYTVEAAGILLQDKVERMVAFATGKVDYENV